MIAALDIIARLFWVGAGFAAVGAYVWACATSIVLPGGSDNDR